MLRKGNVSLWNALFMYLKSMQHLTSPLGLAIGIMLEIQAK